MTLQQWNAYRGDTLAKLFALELAEETLRQKSKKGYVSFQQACSFADFICSNRNMTLAAVRAGLIDSEDECIEIAHLPSHTCNERYIRQKWHERGTIYEAKLWEIYETDGIEAAKGFFAATAVRAFTDNPKQQAA